MFEEFRSFRLTRQSPEWYSIYHFASKLYHRYPLKHYPECTTSSALIPASCHCALCFNEPEQNFLVFLTKLSEELWSYISCWWRRSKLASLKQHILPLARCFSELEREKRRKYKESENVSLCVYVFVWVFEHVAVLVKCLIFATCFSVCHQCRVTNPKLFPK